MQINLSSASESLVLLASSTSGVDLHYHIGYADIPTAISGATASIDSDGVISSTSTTTILNNAGSGVTRRVQHLHIFNNTLNSVDVSLYKDNTSNNTYYFRLSLNSYESIRVVNDKFSIYDVNGIEKSIKTATDLLGESKSLFKIGTAPEAAGQFYCFAKDTGFPGAWSTGNPGINGRNCIGTAAADAGCISLANPSSGNWYLRDINVSATVAAQFILHDFLWVNTGLNVTTTTARLITQPTLPSRDADGTSNGLGVQVGILVTTATTNASAVTTIKLSYTNSDGTSGRTATISSFPATAVVGTLVKFQLAAGDKGVRSIQSITLGTTLTAGAISLVCFNEIASTSVILANVGSLAYPRKLDLILQNGFCLIPLILASSTTAVTVNGNIYFINK